LRLRRRFRRGGRRRLISSGTCGPLSPIASKCYPTGDGGRAPLSHSARDYVRAFDLTCIALWRDGRLGVSRNPKGAEAAWWCPAKDAGALIRDANANGRDVAAAAARLKTPLTPHATVAQRATEAVDRIDASLNAAQRRGDLGSSTKPTRLEARPPPLKDTAL
jgi:hypothetical protein